LKLSVAVEDGTSIEFECPDTVASKWTSRTILTGETYPYYPFVPDVEIVFDVGANCGAASVHFSRHYPDAQVHAFEPGHEARSFLEHNVVGFENVHVHPIGFSRADGAVPLYKGAEDLGQASLHRRPVNLDESELVELRVGAAWAREHQIERIDVLKVDVEGAEVDVLEGLAELLPTVKVLYVEYDSRRSRRLVDRLVDRTHELYSGRMLLDQGECVYVRNDVADQSRPNSP
jgi:FkbM family methyltransferase